MNNTLLILNRHLLLYLPLKYKIPEMIRVRILAGIFTIKDDTVPRDHYPYNFAFKITGQSEKQSSPMNAKKEPSNPVFFKT